MWIDTHAHLNDHRFDDALPAVLERASTAGVVAVLVIGIDAESSAKAVALAQRHAPLFAVVGIQPNSLAEMRPGDWERIVALVEDTKVVGIGETGMDRYWDRAPIDLQRQYFLRHLELARRADKPVVIHCREAGADVVEVLTEFTDRSGKPLAGVMHSFTGDAGTATACLDLGLHISFAGMVTFKKNVELRAVAATVPLERLLVETDAPFLTPHPLRGKPNEPAFVVHTGSCLAEVHGVSAQDLAATTSANARRLFGLTGSTVSQP